MSLLLLTSKVYHSIWAYNSQSFFAPLLNFTSPMFSKALKEPHTSFEILFLGRSFISRTLHCPFWLFRPPQTPNCISRTQQTLCGFLLPVPMSENGLQVVSQEDLRNYLICSLLSGIMVCGACCPISKNRQSLYFVQFYCSSLSWVIGTSSRMRAES